MKAYPEHPFKEVIQQQATYTQHNSQTKVTQSL